MSLEGSKRALLKDMETFKNAALDSFDAYSEKPVTQAELHKVAMSIMSVFNTLAAMASDDEAQKQNKS